MVKVLWVWFGGFLLGLHFNRRLLAWVYFFQNNYSRLLGLNAEVLNYLNTCIPVSTGSFFPRVWGLQLCGQAGHGKGQWNPASRGRPQAALGVRDTP